MKKKVSLIRLIRFWGIIIVLTIAAIISIADIITSYDRLDANIKKTRANYLKKQKALIRHEVERVINTIQYERKQCKILAKAAVKQRVYEAWTIATNIYNVNKNSKSPQAIKRMIVDALSPIKFPGNGYYFIVTFNGENVLLNNMPDMKGKKIIDVQDFDGRYVIKDIIAIAKNLPCEGFYNYTWTKPNQQIGLPKTSYIKKFAPYNWAIGAGLYIDNVETMVKEYKTAYKMTVEKYRIGESTVLDILIIQGKWIAAEIKRLQIVKRRLINRINLHLALGGSFDAK